MRNSYCCSLSIQIEGQEADQAWCHVMKFVKEYRGGNLFLEKANKEQLRMVSFRTGDA